MKTFKKLILDDLKASGLGALAKKVQSIRYETYSGGSSVRVSTVDLSGNEREAFDALLAKYRDGYFDGSQDLFVYTDQPKAERTAKFVFLNNEFSEEMKKEIRDYLAHDGVTDDQSAQAVLGQYYDTAIHQWLSYFHFPFISRAELLEYFGEMMGPHVDPYLDQKFTADLRESYELLKREERLTEEPISAESKRELLIAKEGVE